MNSWTSMLGAILLVLILWTGGTANAADRFDCNPATTAASDYDGGSQDQLPSSPDKCVTHNHSGCGGHHLATPTSTPSMQLALRQETATFAWHEVGIPGHSPDSELRPPIA